MRIAIILSRDTPNPQLRAQKPISTPTSNTLHAYECRFLGFRLRYFFLLELTSPHLSKSAFLRFLFYARTKFLVIFHLQVQVQEASPFSFLSTALRTAQFLLQNKEAGVIRVVIRSIPQGTFVFVLRGDLVIFRTTWEESSSTGRI